MSASRIQSERIKAAFLTLRSVGVCMVAFAVMGLAALARARDSKDVKNYLRRFEAFNHATRSLRANFVQVYAAGGGRRTESGTVYLARGGRMRWHYRKPEEKLFIGTGKELILYVPAERQATISGENSSGDVRQAFSLLLSGRNPGRMFARIEFDDGAPPHRPGDRVLRAVPKNAGDAGFTQALIELGPGFDVRRLVIVFDSGSKMKFSFSMVERNAPLGPDLFRFVPPPGTLIIHQP